MQAPVRGDASLPLPSEDTAPWYQRACGKRLLLGVLAWTLVVGVALVFSLRTHHADAFAHARLVANAYVDKDLLFRSWVTRHGGVYVRPSEQTPPNPYLQVPNRDVVTTQGMELTLVNPAYATRELLEEFAIQHGVRGRLTSTKLKNPGNAPDAWEEGALRRLDQGEPEVVEQLQQDGVPVLRLMRPVYMEKGCLKCHGDLNIPIGALRGGLSVSLPMKPYEVGESAATRVALISHGGFWLVGILGLVILYRRNVEQQSTQARVEYQRRREELRINTILGLGERFETLEVGAMVKEGLEAAETLTHSGIGFFHFVNEDQQSLELSTWTRATLEHCRAVYDTHYPLDKAGVWADCARIKRPVVLNDYATAPNRRGMPEGHSPLQRLLTVPVIEGGLVRVIMGVGNKVAPYDDGDVELVQSLANDIWRMVQRKKVESRLRASERLLREAQRVGRLGSWSLDHGTGEMEWSEEMFAICGVPVGSQPTNLETLRQFTHPEDRERAAALLEAALAEHREFQACVRIVTAEGGVRQVLLRGQTSYAPDGTPRSTVGTLQDISEQERLESLRRSEANLLALFENTDWMIWSVDAQLRLVVGNRRFQDFMEQQAGGRLQAGEVLPFARLPLAVAEPWQHHYQQALEGLESRAELQLPAASGGNWLEFQFVPIQDPDTQLAGVTVFGLDFTERKAAEADRARAMAHMEQMLRERQLLHRQTLLVNNLNDLLQSCHDEAEAYKVIGLTLAELFPGSYGCLAIMQEDSELRRVALWGESPCSMAQGFALDDCWALRRGSLHVVDELEHGLLCRHLQGLPVHGYFCLPLIVQGETLGLLHFAYLEACDRATRDGILSLAQSVGETLKLSLSNLRLRVAMQDQVIHDPLTGLFNRRYLDESLPRELHRARRGNSKLAIGMLDIDHFKRFNDSLGHEAGDLVLREIGQILVDNLRRSDIACRYGGEELLVIMPDSSAADAAARLERICQLIRNRGFEYQGQALVPITLSGGIAEAFVHGHDAATLLRCADQALYRAKAAGRDRVLVAPLPEAGEEAR